jgi:hypothetical protein
MAIDETKIKLNGRWQYLWAAIDVDSWEIDCQNHQAQEFPRYADLHEGSVENVRQQTEGLRG